MTWYITMVVLVSPIVLAYPNGPPVDRNPGICGTMMPNHGYTAQTGASPFSVVTNSDCYKDGLEITVEVRLNGDKDTFFEGVFVQARSGDVATASHGTFSTTDPQLQTLNCFSGTDNAIGHKEAHHYQSKTFKWTSTAGQMDPIKFRATVVHETEEYWVGVESVVLSHSSTCATPGQLPPTVALPTVTMTGTAEPVDDTTVSVSGVTITSSTATTVILSLLAVCLALVRRI